MRFLQIKTIEKDLVITTELFLAHYLSHEESFTAVNDGT
jgi:hypothetical protein